MPARIPTQQKSPFEIDPRPWHEMSSPRAGLLATSRAFRSLGIPALAAAHLPLKQRQRGFDEAQYLEALVLLQTAGGDCPEDMQLLGNDPCLERGSGFPLPTVGAVRSFLERFHDEAWEQSRPARAVQKSFISACHENGLLAWLRHPDRAQEPGGRIGFAVSAQRSVELTAALTQVPDAQWRTYNREADGTFMYTMKSRTKPAAGTCPANISPSTPPGSSSRC